MMPLSELYHIDSTQQKNTNCSTDLSFIPDSDFVELVWENGQILMQGQSSSRARKTSNSDTLPYYDLPSHTFRSQVKDIGNDINSKIGRFGTTDSILNELGLSEDDEDDMVPWLNCHIDDSLQQDCYSDFLTGLSGVTENELSTSQTNFASLEKRSNFNQPIRDSHSFSVNYGVSVEQGSVPKVVDGVFYKPKTSQVYPLSSPQRQTSIPSYSSRVSDVTSNDTSIATHSAVCGDMSVIQASSSGYSHIEMQIQNPGLPNSSSGFMNFSHFSRPASMIKANLHNIDAVAGPSLPSVERIRCKDKRSVTSSGNPAEITLIDSNNGLSNDLRKGMSSNSQTIMAPTNVDTKPLMARPVNEPHPAEQSDALCHVDASKNDKTYSRAVGSNAYNGITDGENTIEAAVASSSVCSVSSVDRTSNDPTHDLKRKCHDTEVSDCPSDDVEEESVGAKKASSARGGSGSKRSRAAEVHNLSERRRRDRINEKMRALQELIPNCNKVDKASMLDEAIEYLKTLQLQLQIMSMGAGLYMQPMILPTGMQHMHAAHMAHFSPMGVGMGMVDVKGGSPGYPIMQVPPMQGVHFRGPPISGPSRLHAMAGSNLQMFGHAGQGHPMSMSHSPMIPLSAGPPMKSAIGVISSAGPVRNLNSAQACEKSGKI